MVEIPVEIVAVLAVAVPVEMVAVAAVLVVVSLVAAVAVVLVVLVVLAAVVSVVSLAVAVLVVGGRMVQPVKRAVVVDPQQEELQELSTDATSPTTRDALDSLIHAI